MFKQTSATSTVCVIGPLVVFVAVVVLLGAAEPSNEVVAAEEPSVVDGEEVVLSCEKASTAKPSSETNHCCIVPHLSMCPSRSGGGLPSERLSAFEGTVDVFSYQTKSSSRQRGVQGKKDRRGWLAMSLCKTVCTQPCVIEDEAEAEAERAQDMQTAARRVGNPTLALQGLGLVFELCRALGRSLSPKSEWKNEIPTGVTWS